MECAAFLRQRLGAPGVWRQTLSAAQVWSRRPALDATPAVWPTAELNASRNRVWGLAFGKIGRRRATRRQWGENVPSDPPAVFGPARSASLLQTQGPGGDAPSDAEPVGRLVFMAGDWFSYWPGWQVGALDKRTLRDGLHRATGDR